MWEIREVVNISNLILLNALLELLMNVLLCKTVMQNSAKFASLNRRHEVPETRLEGHTLYVAVVAEVPEH